MFRDCRLFRLILDELEKTLVLVDLSIARDYADLVADETARRIIFSMVEREYQLTRDMVLRISGDKEIAQRFTQYRARLDQRLPTINEVNREQVELLRRFRAAEDELTKEQYKSALLLSINCIAAGLGATG
jgi:phosphoenolpyruvate carboxylase